VRIAGPERGKPASKTGRATPSLRLSAERSNGANSRKKKEESANHEKRGRHAGLLDRNKWERKNVKKGAENAQRPGPVLSEVEKGRRMPKKGQGDGVSTSARCVKSERD